MTNRASFRTPKSPYPRGQAAAYWRTQGSRWEESGLLQADFCRRHRISLAALRWWRSELNRRDRDRTGRKPAGPVFLPVRVIPTPVSAGPMLEVELRGGRIVRVRQDFDPLLLRKVVAALEDSPC